MYYIMRRTRRIHVIENFQAIHKAHKIIEKYNGLGDADISQVYEACQSSAIRIGNEIEHWEGEGTDTVSLLEDYCEEIYQCSQSDMSCSGQTVYSKLEESIKKAEKSFEQEIPNDKLEVVFFPYNASMWESLASVWEAANRDEDCNAYVVPIPYFEKNPDGSFGKMHYEGNMFPQEVPIISWKEYDFAQRYPDIIFIHNPYDQNNFVTSVHPNYYSSVLKEYTHNLIYIPYYLFVNNYVKDTTVITCAALYADYLIIQSEECCKKCIQLYDDCLVENGLTGKLKSGKQKFLPLGSPIADSLKRNVSVEDLPAEWQKIIKSKGARSKIVLYNTHISNVMGFKLKDFLNKIRYVFEIFRSQKDIVLLWRPHPLTWQTIHSMNPGAAEEYRKIVDAYKDEGWGIYDDTVHMNRSVAVSDAYYGDWSSLITMFRMSGKPVVKQDLSIMDVTGNPAVNLRDLEKQESDYIDEQELGLIQYLKLIDKNERCCREDLQIGKKIWDYFKKKQ